eukprot:comp17899_c0_seq1/m.18147 comp17899_c0_seq1/g.18147  ORF comp17899_c0_seq1/g.18147 comp17899_c0_seq1/m.18147 type:complete len:264 (-) comp17899_c0_seq1:43-834(-)
MPFRKRSSKKSPAEKQSALPSRPQPTSRKRKHEAEEQNETKRPAKRPRPRKSTKKAKKENPVDLLPEYDPTAKPVFVLAHGAGTDSTHPNMQRWKNLLSDLGDVFQFDYKKPFNKMERLVETHLKGIEDARKLYKYRPIFLVGTSMGSRVAVHLYEVHPPPPQVRAMIALGYPLQQPRGDTSREPPLLSLPTTTRLLFISGTKDNMCPPPALESVRARMKARSELLVIEGGDHSLKVRNRRLGQEAIDGHIVDRIRQFVTSCV